MMQPIIILAKKLNNLPTEPLKGGSTHIKAYPLKIMSQMSNVGMMTIEKKGIV